jgi:hypothetical protein
VKPDAGVGPVPDARDLHGDVADTGLNGPLREVPVANDCRATIGGPHVGELRQERLELGFDGLRDELPSPAAQQIVQRIRDGFRVLSNPDMSLKRGLE